MLEFYASLAGKTPEQSDKFDGMPIWFHVETPLTKSELMYAIETTFNLNWLGIVQVDDTRISLARIKERGPHAGKQNGDQKPGL